jgi:hypothetical protein
MMPHALRQSAAPCRGLASRQMTTDPIALVLRLEQRLRLRQSEGSTRVPR